MPHFRGIPLVPPTKKVEVVAEISSMKTKEKTTQSLLHGPAHQSGLTYDFPVLCGLCSNLRHSGLCKRPHHEDLTFFLTALISEERKRKIVPKQTRLIQILTNEVVEYKETI